VLGSAVPSEPKIKPQAFRLDKGHPLAAEEEPRRAAFTIEPVADFVEAEAASAAGIDPTEQAVEAAQRGGITKSALISWGGLFFSAAGGFILVALGNWIAGLIEELFARSPILGFAAVILGGLAIFALVVSLPRSRPFRPSAGRARSSSS
jgi:putative membrane protein